MRPQDVTVVVLSRDRGAALQRCLDSLRDAKVANIVVLSAAVPSGDGAQDMESAFDTEIGLEANLAMQRAQTPLILFLHAEVYPDPGAIETLTARFTDKRIVAAGGRVVDSDGATVETAGPRLRLVQVATEALGIEKPLTRRLPTDRDSRVERLSETCLMMRTNAEPWDERFKAGGADADLCLRLHRHGEILYVPSAVFKRCTKPELGQENAGRDLYFRIHHGIVQAFLCSLLDRIGSMRRAMRIGRT